MTTAISSPRWCESATRSAARICLKERLERARRALQGVTGHLASLGGSAHRPLDFDYPDGETVAKWLHRYHEAEDRVKILTERLDACC